MFVVGGEICLMVLGFILNLLNLLFLVVFFRIDNILLVIIFWLNFILKFKIILLGLKIKKGLYCICELIIE